LAKNRRRASNNDSTLGYYASIAFIAIVVISEYPRESALGVSLLILAFSIRIYLRKRARIELKKKYGNNADAIELMKLINQLLSLEQYNLSKKKKTKKKELLTLYKRKLQQNQRGYVYFVQEEAMKSVKIGKALDPYHRINNGFNVKIPYKLELVYLVKTENDLETEKLFHDYFSTKRINGEWFELDEKDIEWIRSGEYPETIVNTLVQT
jgi:hypothetical protein